jgi:two-component system OmpR family response regulator
MRLLIVDDNAALTWRLQSFLSNSFDVHVARTGTEGLRLAKSGRFDAMILDLRLPDLDGETICVALRKQQSDMPILILSGEGDLEYRVRLLNEGADDYLTKPFETKELLARTKALMRRNHRMTTSSALRVGDLVIDTSKRSVTRGGIPIDLRRKEFDILECLARNHGTVVTPAMILDQVWEDPENDGWGTIVRVHIKNLRDKIDKPFQQPLIRTARGVGYMLLPAEQ